MRKLEALFAALIAVMAFSFAWMFGETKPNGVELLVGEKIHHQKTAILSGIQIINHLYAWS